jgi:hypothetical protein
MTKITNTASGARGVRTNQGLVMVEPGQTVDVELADNEDELYEGLEKGAAAAKRAAEEDVAGEAEAPAPAPAKK